MDSTNSHNFGGGKISAIYCAQTQLPPLTVPLHSNTYTVTPPESLASGARDPGQPDVPEVPDVARLADVLDEERRCNEDPEIKDVELIDDNPGGPVTPMVQMVHLSPNKIAPCDENSRGKFPSLASQNYLKDSMKEIFIHISNAEHLSGLLVLQGADGGVCIHRSIIATFSKLIKDQLAEFPDSTTVLMPNYSQKIIRKVAEILYTGETFYSESEKKDVNLIWEAMRQLQINFSDKSFYCHPVERTVVKEEEEEESSQQNLQQQQATTPEGGENQEVDQTDESWYEDQSNNQDAFSISRVVRRPHPENPSKSVIVHSQYGEGRKIQRSMPAFTHVNADEIKEREREENQKEIEALLSKHKPIEIVLDDDEDKNSKPSKTITVFDDAAFKEMYRTGKINKNLLKSVNLGQQPGKRLKTQQTCMVDQSTQIPYPIHLVLVSPPTVETIPSGNTEVDEDRVTIPPNRPEGTGIKFVRQNPSASTSIETTAPFTTNTSSLASVTEMPTLIPVADQQRPGGSRTQRTRKFSADITDIPRLDRIHNEHIENSEDLPVTTPGGAIFIPKSKLNRFLKIDSPVKKCANAVNSQPERIAGTSQDASGRPMRKRKYKLHEKDAFVMTEEVMRMREDWKKEQQEAERTKKEIVLASTSKPVPLDTTFDAYVETLEEEKNEADIQRVMGQLDPSIRSALGAHVNNANETSQPGSSSGVNASRVGPTSGKQGKAPRRGGPRPDSPSKSERTKRGGGGKGGGRKPGGRSGNK